MSKKVDVILLEDVEGVGQAGDIVSVSEGQARNSLFPEGLAALADERVKTEKEARDAKQALADEAKMAELQDQASALDGTELVLEAEVKDGNEIFGSIGQKEVAKQLESQSGLQVKGKDITLAAPLTTLGSEDVLVSLGEGIEATVRVTITAAAGSASEDEEE